MHLDGKKEDLILVFIIIFFLNLCSALVSHACVYLTNKVDYVIGTACSPSYLFLLLCSSKRYAMEDTVS